MYSGVGGWGGSSRLVSSPHFEGEFSCESMGSKNVAFCLLDLSDT